MGKCEGVYRFGDYEYGSLRSAWNTHPKDADVHQTWVWLQAEGIKASSTGRPGDYRKSIKHYEKALDKGAGKDVRRRMNRVRTEMDERGIERADSDSSMMVRLLFTEYLQLL